MEDSVRRSRGWRRRTCGPCPDSAAVRHGDTGQSLVEFALVIPIFLVLLMAVIEFAFLMNGQLSINYATRDAALIAAEAGNASLETSPTASSCRRSSRT